MRKEAEKEVMQFSVKEICDGSRRLVPYMNKTVTVKVTGYLPYSIDLGDELRGRGGFQLSNTKVLWDDIIDWDKVDFLNCEITPWNEAKISNEKFSAGERITVTGKVQVPDDHLHLGYIEVLNVEKATRSKRPMPRTPLRRA